MAYNYTLNTFLATPTDTDTTLKIYDKNRVLKYTVDPDLSYFYVKNNLLIIKVENNNDIILDFKDAESAIKALSVLNSAKNKILNNIKPADSVNKLTYSLANLNMAAEVTTQDGDLACNDPVGEKPQSPIRVQVNGIEVNVGPDLDCYFSPDGTNKRAVGEETKGDFLYWNGSVIGYELDTIDEIDFIYLIYVTL